MLGHIQAFINIPELDVETKNKFIGVKESIKEDLITLLKHSSVGVVLTDCAYSPSQNEDIKPVATFLGGEGNDFDHGLDPV